MLAAWGPFLRNFGKIQQQSAESHIHQREIGEINSLSVVSTSGVFDFTEKSNCTSDSCEMANKRSARMMTLSSLGCSCDWTVESVPLRTDVHWHLQHPETQLHRVLDDHLFRKAKSLLLILEAELKSHSAWRTDDETPPTTNRPSQSALKRSKSEQRNLSS